MDPHPRTAPSAAGLLRAFRRRWVLNTFVGLSAAAVVGFGVWLARPTGQQEARAPVLDRNEREGQWQRLQQAEEGLKAEIDALEQWGKQVTRKTDAAREGQARRLAALQTQAGELAAEIGRLETEVARAASGLTALRRKPTDSKVVPIQALPDATVDADPRVVALAAARERAEAQLERDRQIATRPDTDETVRDSAEALAKATQALQEARRAVAAEIEKKHTAPAPNDAPVRIAELEKTVAAITDLLGKFKLRQDNLNTAIAAAAESGFEVSSLLPDLAPRREALARVQSQLVELRVRGELGDQAAVAEPAQGFPNTNTARRTVLAGVAGLGAFAIVVLLAAFLEWRTRRVDGVDEVVNELGMRVIGTLPAFPEPAGTRGASWRFALAEAVASTRTVLLHAARERSMQVVMVTSATPGEGKTSLASQLAASMATAGMRALLVDCDLRNPSIHTLFGLSPGAGVAEILTQDMDAADAIQPTPVPNLWVISAGKSSHRVLAALAQGHPLEALFNRLRGEFDFVIVDSCPVLPVADALLVGPHVDGVLFAIMRDVSRVPVVRLAAEKLGQLNVPLLGAVVSGIKQDVYSDGYNDAKQPPE